MGVGEGDASGALGCPVGRTLGVDPGPGWQGKGLSQPGTADVPRPARVDGRDSKVTPHQSSPQAPPRDPDSGALLLTSPDVGPGHTPPSLRWDRAGQATYPGDLTASGVQKNNVLDSEKRHCHLRICKQKPQTQSCQMRGTEETQGTGRGGAAGGPCASARVCTSLRCLSTSLCISK